MKKSRQEAWLTKAYNNHAFLNSPDARILRVLSEMVEPAARLRRKNVSNTVVFFGSARTVPPAEAQKNFAAIERKVEKTTSHSQKLIADFEQAHIDLKMSQYYEDAARLAEKLTHWFREPQNRKKGFVVCSGGGPGIMEAANRGAHQAGGESMGLNISLPMEQDPNRYQSADISFEFHYFFIRKFWFFYLGKALIVFPGGFGTCDELFELLTLIQTQKTKKYMPIVLYGKAYWENLINFDLMVKWRMIDRNDLRLFRCFDDVDEAFQYLKKELKKHYL